MSPAALAVDPNPIDLALAARALTDLAFDVLVASTFDDATRHILAAEKLSLLVSDVRLGEYNGIHLAFRARARHPSVFVVITHDVFDPTLDAEARRLGGTYCVKPLAIDQWTALVGHLSTPPAAAASHQARRWPRKQIGSELIATVGDREARLLDISYGGVRLELTELQLASSLPSTFDIVVPTYGVCLTIHPVWTRPAASPAAWLCGAEVIGSDQESVWRQFVDTVPAGLEGTELL